MDFNLDIENVSLFICTSSSIPIMHLSLIQKHLNFKMWFNEKKILNLSFFKFNGKVFH